MKKLMALGVFLLAACQSSSLPSGTYIEPYPSAFLEPIKISAKKSEEGKVEFEEFIRKYREHDEIIYFSDGQLSYLLKEEKEKDYMEKHYQLSPRANIALTKVWEVGQASFKELKALESNIQDSEVKAFAKRLIDVEFYSFKNRIKATQMLPYRYAKPTIQGYQQFAEMESAIENYTDKKREAVELVQRAGFELAEKYDVSISSQLGWW